MCLRIKFCNHRRFVLLYFIKKKVKITALYGTVTYDDDKSENLHSFTANKCLQESIPQLFPNFHRSKDDIKINRTVSLIYPPSIFLIF
jgi:hypothetical protein